IECSAMVKKYLGDTIDIHAGGQDLSFPHHENEIAQSEALNEQPFARYWMHNGYINIQNEKMSKSKGNFVLVHDMIKEVDPQLLRFFILSVHYRHPINFSDELLTRARNGFERIKKTYENICLRIELSRDVLYSDSECLLQIEVICSEFMDQMNDDYHTANVISVMYKLVKLANQYMIEITTSKQVMELFIQVFDKFLHILGITFIAEQVLLDDDIERFIQE